MRWIERQWSEHNVLTLPLWLLSLIFGAVASTRRTLYRAKILDSTRLPVPVLVIGNISVGGTGKTPLVLWAAQYLCRAGYHPGIIARGYGGDGSQHSVTAQSDPTEVGDEPVILARRAQVPVFVGRNRVLAGRALLSAHPECDVLVADDGLQHYALHRDAEIAVVDGMRGLGNGLLLPAGPLREPPRRLHDVDAVICNGLPMSGARRCMCMRLVGERWYNVGDATREAAFSAFKGRPLHAIAGIGNPARFFDTLRTAGLQCAQYAFPDHYSFCADDLAFARDDIVLMTEKDAVNAPRSPNRTGGTFPSALKSILRWATSSSRR